MVSSSTRRMSWRALAPIVAIAAVGLTACSNNEEPTDVPGTTPPVWTGSAAPGDSHGDSHGSESGAGGAQAGSAQGGGAAGAATLTAGLKAVDGADAGTVSFAEQDGGVQVTIDVEGLAPGYHGVHVHAVGKCEPESVAPTGGAPGAFLSAGPHLQVEGSTSVPESGDLVSVVVHEDGTATTTVTTNAFTLEDLQGEEGTSVVVHEDNLGARQACGVIE
ncbi:MULTISPECIES: superoxide dismutase family protein [unclassified Rhodococcus (in: high G+C Gram-positive bacteria)]|jgi:superoxide dismutase, Cu-Zn family|uniref:superoxide dismutase family protein n=1 Tax=unclassified Rhodococcus (in: high G+C Gram-positive bacteria) TaxID=192944 RepID=UPI00146BBAB4|nr:MULTISPECIES: superoxide dismutase family protein [unclassified Rhodococcus (in: high G+C Gram-positive bacteria)]MBF0661606.1 superoxide dismutase family protein [Rhodococcus sp. (in: high G+C Gram-positive bacteria)]NMD94009.1 superoxide dismutase family protein [Rhodococcus sp. BL-253-APC-6A1W]NME77741.1 superoxide dismutase family protein [Rhodococcus sp. 105337]